MIGAKSACVNVGDQGILFLVELLFLRSPIVLHRVSLIAVKTLFSFAV